MTIADRARAGLHSALWRPISGQLAGPLAVARPAERLRLGPMFTPLAR